MMAMRTKFASVTMTTTVRDTMSAMVEEKEWCVLLLDSNQQLVGLLTWADIHGLHVNAMESLSRRPTTWKVDMSPNNPVPITGLNRKHSILVIEGQTHSGMPRGAKNSLALNELNRLLFIHIETISKHTPLTLYAKQPMRNHRD